jgi:hypothetical protein
MASTANHRRAGDTGEETLPRANPKASFETAAKHLVRHLHDAAALRRNPLTSAFFADAGSAKDTCLSDRESLQQIHRLFRAAAEQCRDAELHGSNADRARRQYAIAIEGCLERRGVASLANELGISYAQYYRDRAEIGLRICRFIRDRQEHATAVPAQRFDAFRFGMERATRLTELGETDRAVAEYTRLLRGADAVGQKIEALCETGLALHVHHGPSDTSERALSDAETLLAGATQLSDDERTVATSRTAFVRGMLTWASDPSAAFEMLRTALTTLERLPAAWTNDTRRLYVRILFEFGEALTTFSNSRGSVEALSNASKILSRCENDSPTLALKIDITQLALRMSMLVDPCGWEPVRRRLDRTQELERRATSTGSVDLNLLTLNALSHLQARAGDAAAALDTVRSALTLSKHRPNREIFSEVTLRMARTILYTPLWQETPSVFAAAGPPATAAVRASRKTVVAEYAFRQGAYKQIRSMFSVPEMERRPYVAALVAGAAHELGDREEARALIERAIPAVERAGVAVTIRQTYRIAARVTKDRRYDRRADEIARALTA